MSGELNSNSLPWLQVGELLAAWEKGVRLLRDDADGVGTFDWTVDDFAALVHIRHAIDVALPDVFRERLGNADDEFAALTEVDLRGRGLSIIDDGLPRSPSLWMRLPKKGALRDEFEAIWRSRTASEDSIAAILNVDQSDRHSGLDG